MDYVKWEQWDSNGLFHYAQMKKSEISDYLKRFEKIAAQIMKDKKPDHVVYAVKYFNEHGELWKICFYQQSMTDEEFEKRVATMKNAQVYALHKLK